MKRKVFLIFFLFFGSILLICNYGCDSSVNQMFIGLYYLPYLPSIQKLIFMCIHVYHYVPVIIMSFTSFISYIIFIFVFNIKKHCFIATKDKEEGKGQQKEDLS